MKTRIYAEHSFEVWINELSDFSTNEIDSFDYNWIGSTGDLLNPMKLPIDELTSYYDKIS